MNLTYKVNKTEDGFAYTIFQDDNPWVIQPYEPQEPGFVPMSETRAIELAQAFIKNQQEAFEAAQQTLIQNPE